MKTLFAVIVAAGVGFAAAFLMVSNRLHSEHDLHLAEEQLAWQAQRTTLEAALAEANSRAPVFPMPVAPTLAAIPALPTRLSPAEIVAQLLALNSGPTTQTRTVRQAIYWLEDLIVAGPEALLAIRQFLVRNQDIALGPLKNAQGLPADLVPASVRFGLFDAVKQIGGSEAEKLLAEVLGGTSRAAEVEWLARTLQEIAPNKYRHVALAAARELLSRPAATHPSSPLDRNERDLLFSVLLMYGDTSYVSTAQAQMLRADGEVDRGALKYLQQSLGPQAVPLAAQWYDDPRLTDPAKKEPFARLALNYVGADAQANEFYQKAINDLALSASHRKNLIEDLNRDGFPDAKNLTARDLPLIQNRLSLIEQLAPHAPDSVNAAAFQEAYNDLLNMRDRVTRPPPAAP
jgi:hypothetical protein